MKCRYQSTMKRAVVLGAALFVGSIFSAGCSGMVDDSAESTSEAVTSAISINGTVFDANGNPLSGVVVHLNGNKQSTATTGAAGVYAFTGLAAGSYSVQPSLSGCTFMPTVVNLNGLTASTTVNFDGAGSTCGGPSHNSGATSGALSISGRVLDSSGNPVRNITINLNGSTQAVRLTTSAGSYSFQVNPGSYSIKPTGPCAFTPDVVNLNNLAASRTQDFRAGAGCVGVPSDAGTPAPDATEASAPDVTEASAPDAIEANAPDAREASAPDATEASAPDAAEASAPDATEASASDAREAAAPDAREASAPDASVPDAKEASASDASDAGAVDVCVPTTCAAAGRVCGALADGCGGTLQCGTCVAGSACNPTGTACVSNNPCSVSTTACLQSRPAGCLQCAIDNGCLDPTQIGGVCEGVSGIAPAACQSVLASSTVPTETQVCLKTLNDIFVSGCAADGQETPCLCGATDPIGCQNGSVTPAGAVFPAYQCDLGPAISSIVSNFTLPTTGAGMADTIVQCVAAFGCTCF